MPKYVQINATSKEIFNQQSIDIPKHNIVYFSVLHHQIILKIMLCLQKGPRLTNAVIVPKKKREL